MADGMERLHASCVAIRGRALLITGPSGVGKSDLCLRLIDRGACLVADDQTELRAQEGQLLARAPKTILHRIEVRGLGIIEMTAESDVPVALEVALGEAAPRFPLEIEDRVVAGLSIPLVRLSRHDPSLAIKAELALERLA